MKSRWKEELIARSRTASTWGELLVILAYVSLTLFSPHVTSRLAFHTPFDGIAVFAPLFVGGFLLLLREMRFKAPVFLILPLVRLSIFTFSGLVGEVGADVLLVQVSMTLLSITVFLFFFNYRHGGELFRRMLTVFSFFVSVQIIACVIGLGSGFDKNAVLAGIGFSNYAATFLLISITVLLFRAANKVEIGVLILSVFALLLTMSTGAFIALLIVFAVWYRGLWIRHPKPCALILVAAVLAIVVFGILSSQILFLYRLTRPIWTRFQQIFSGNFEAATSSRLTLYRYSLKSIGRNPAFGAILNVNEGFDTIEYTRHAWSRTHNLFLESLLLYGIVGSLCNVGIVAEIIYRGRRILREKPGRRVLVLTLIVMAVHGLVEPNFFTILYDMFVWAVLGVFLSSHPAPDDDLTTFLRPAAEPKKEDASPAEATDAATDGDADA